MDLFALTKDVSSAVHASTGWLQVSKGRAPFFNCIHDTGHIKMNGPPSIAGQAQAVRPRESGDGDDRRSSTRAIRRQPDSGREARVASAAAVAKEPGADANPGNDAATCSRKL